MSIAKTPPGLHPYVNAVFAHFNGVSLQVVALPGVAAAGLDIVPVAVEGANQLTVDTFPLADIGTGMRTFSGKGVHLAIRPDKANTLTPGLNFKQERVD